MTGPTTPLWRWLAPVLALAALTGATTAVTGLGPAAAASETAATQSVAAPQIGTAVQGRPAAFTAGAAPAPADPYGLFRTLGTPYADRIIVSGWAADPSTSTSVPIDVVIDGVVRGGGLAATPGGQGTYGFDLTVPAPAGSVTACVIARNRGPGIDTQLGCRDLRPPPLSSGYAWMGTEPRGHPLRFNPCTPVIIAYNPAGGPSWGRAELDVAVAEIRAATGLDVRVTSTTEPAVLARPAVDLARYGAAWSPILLGYSTPEAISSLGGGVAGLGGPSTAWGPDGRVSVTGIVILDGPQVAGLPTGWGGGATLAKLMAHELGHVLGLSHVNDTAQLMNPVIPSRAGGYGAGDRAGLWYLGRGQSCRRMPVVPVGATVSAAADDAGPPPVDGTGMAPDGLPEISELIEIG